MEEHEGLRAMQAEMGRQRQDALASLDGVAQGARLVADHARRTGNLVLYGIGGSHHVNRIAEPLYRDLGLRCVATAASEALMSPFPPSRRTALIVSQSGQSGEIVDLIGRASEGEDRFALTLDRGSVLASAARAALVGVGGPEQAFAATRSIVITLALHGAVLEALGAPQPGLRAALLAEEPVDLAAADDALAGCDTIAFVGAHAMQGVAQSAALSMMELARIPTLAFEGGQFRHGPYEFLRPGLAVILFRSGGPDGATIPPLATAAAQAGCTTLLVDASGEPGPPEIARLALPAASGLAAAARMLLIMQTLNIKVARRRVQDRIGTPLRTSKVTV